MHIRHSLLAAAIICACSACSQAPDTSTTAASTPTRSAPAPAPAATKPDIGIDLAGVDHTVKPGHDVFTYSNSTCLKTLTLPDDRSGTSTFLSPAPSRASAIGHVRERVNACPVDSALTTPACVRPQTSARPSPLRSPRRIRSA